MKRRSNRSLGLCGVAVAACLSAVLPALAAAGTVPADLRVVTDTGKTLADVRQYTDTTRVPTSPRARCFFGGVGGSGKPVTVPGPTALGLSADASQSQVALRPLLVTDEFSFGLGVCGFGGVSSGATNFWQLRVDHKAVQVAGDHVALGKGDDVLWALVPNPVCQSTPPYSCQPTEPELSLRAPADAKPGRPFTVQAFQYNDTGFVRPAAGAAVTGAATPTDASGKTRVTLQATSTVQATRSGAIPSRAMPVCISSKPSRCSNTRGRLILGSKLGDQIAGTPGPDNVKARGGNDVINVRGGGKDRVRCGAGFDMVIADRRDVVDKRSCERIIRPGGKRKGKKR